MEYRKLGQTNEEVSVICLGTMNWGEQNTEVEAHQQMDYSVTQGINFFDTAEIYAVPPNKNSYGKTEEFIGSWFKKSGKRDDIFLASKVVSRSDRYYARGGDEPRVNKEQIKYAIEGSLKRLGVNHIDLYQVHWPDRKTNFFGPRGYTHDANDVAVEIEETLEAMQELVKEGKIRYVGVSNERPWGIMEYLRLSREKDLPRIASIQNPYSLIMRGYETGMAEMSIREKVSLLVYSPLAMGVLTGKYLGGKMPKDSRFDYSKRNNDHYNPEHAQPAIREYVELAKKHGLDPAQMALAFVNSRDFVTSNIIGARTMEQLKIDIASIDIKLSDEVIAGIEDIHLRMPDPIS
ncbi:MAG: aldo/keto reductase [Candidatus Pacebacteria bacterium]|nr:aldo/keto reductase [Candidatus Paceibacterota bacterium]